MLPSSLHSSNLEEAFLALIHLADQVNIVIQATLFSFVCAFNRPESSSSLTSVVGGSPAFLNTQKVPFQLDSVYTSLSCSIFDRDLCLEQHYRQGVNTSLRLITRYGQQRLDPRI